MNESGSTSRAALADGQLALLLRLLVVTRGAARASLLEGLLEILHSTNYRVAAPRPKCPTL